MDLMIFAAACVFTLLLAVVGLWRGSIFALMGLLFGAIMTLSLSSDSAITVAREYATIWRAQNVTPYPAGYLLIMLTILNFVVIVKKMRSV